MHNIENIPILPSQDASAPSTSLSKKEHFRHKMKTQLVIQKGAAIKERLLQQSSQISGQRDCFREYQSIPTDSFAKEYDELDKIGEGTHSVVKTCRNKLTNKLYAVKIIRSDDQEVVDQAKEEFRIVRSLYHQNIIRGEKIFIGSSSSNLYTSELQQSFQQQSQQQIEQQSNSLISHQHQQLQQQQQSQQSQLETQNEEQVKSSQINSNTLIFQNSLLPPQQEEINNGLIRIVYELSDKTTLQEFISDGKSSSLSESTLSQIVVQIIDAVAYLHEKGVAHRDIKPSNILIHEQSYKITLIDFGVSRIFQKSREMLTPTGTPFYKAPELLKGDHYSEKVDCWALGVTLFELLTSVRPFSYSHREKEMIMKMEEYAFQNNSKFKNLSWSAKDLLIQLLEPNSSFRISAKEALNHPFIQQDNNNNSNNTNNSNNNHNNNSNFLSSNANSHLNSNMHQTPPKMNHNMNNNSKKPNFSGIDSTNTQENHIQQSPAQNSSSGNKQHRIILGQLLFQ